MGVNILKAIDTHAEIWGKSTFHMGSKMPNLKRTMCSLIILACGALPGRAEEPAAQQPKLREYSQEKFAQLIGHIVLGMVDAASTEKVFELLGDELSPWQGGSPFPLEFTNEEPGYRAQFLVKFGDEDCRCNVTFSTLGKRNKEHSPLIGQFDVIRHKDGNTEHMLLRTRDKSGDNIFDRDLP